MLQDPSVEMYIENAIKPVLKQIKELKAEVEELKKALHKTDCSTQLSADSSTEDEYCKCEHPTLGKSVSRCGTCDRWFKPIA